MNWLRKYHANLLSKIYNGSLYGGADRLETLLPFFIGGALFAVIDIALDLGNSARWILLAMLVAPGVLWALYVLFHEARSLPQRHRRHKNVAESGRDE